MGVEVGGCGSTSIKVMGIIFASEYACTIKRDWGGGYYNRRCTHVYTYHISCDIIRAYRQVNRKRKQQTEHTLHVNCL